MWAYILRRVLLMIPTLIGISLINFLLINSADAPRAGNMSTEGVVDASASADAGEAERIFRGAFNLDKPVLLNTRFGLEDTEIFWFLTAPLRDYSSIAQKSAARDLLEDYGRTIVPHLLRIADSATSHAIPDEFRTDYKERWTEAREIWLEGDRPLDESIPWPPPADPPPFDRKFNDTLLLRTLDRLYANAPRRPLARYGGNLTEEEQAINRDVRKERRDLKVIFDRTRGEGADPERALADWKEWYASHEEEWNYSFGDKVSMLFLETRFAKYWSNLIHLDLGESYMKRQPVLDLIIERLPVSLTLSLGSLILAYLFALPLGILSGVKHSSFSDQVISILLFALYSMPVMFLGVLLRDYFAVDNAWFPGRGFEGDDHARMTTLEGFKDIAWHVVLPLTTLTIGSLAYYSRYMKAGLLDVIRADYIRTARAKGLNEFVVIMRHAVRNSLIPIVTLLGASLPVVIGGSVIVEVIFQIDGMGLLGWKAVSERDYSVLLGLNIIVAVLTMVGVLLTDLLFAVLDPRFRYR